MAPAANLNLAADFFRHARSSPSRPAIFADGRLYSYEEVAETAARVAGWVGPSDAPRRVGVLGFRSFGTYAAILGASTAGATYVALNPKYPDARLQAILARARLDAIVLDPGAAGRMSADLVAALPPRVLAYEPVPGVNADILDQVTATPLFEPAPCDPEHVAYLMFTSGTTGVPKGVKISAGNVRRFLSALDEIYRLSPDDRISGCHELSFDFSVLDQFLTWHVGASLHAVPESQLMAPASFIQRQELTFWASVPSVVMFMQRLKMLQPNLFPSLRVSYFCGEALTATAAEAWQRAAPLSTVDNHYGPTEATVATSWYRLGSPPVVTRDRGVLSIGVAYPSMRLGVVTEGGAFAATGAEGELALHGPQVAQGYLDAEELTARRFPTLDHPELGSSRWYLTGDLAFEDDAAFFHVLGRVDNQVKVLGHRIELEEIDAHLRAVCQSESVVSLAWPIENGSATGIVAFVAGTAVDSEAIREAMASRVASFMVPRRIVRLEALPLSPHGKIDRQRLRRELEEAGRGP